MDNCLFCKIIDKQIPARIVYEDDLLVAFEDIAPVAPVHLLLVPKRHIDNCLELTPADGPLLAGVFQAARQLAIERGIADGGFRLVANTNSDAGQTVFHLHFHLLGGRHLGWPPG